MPAYNKIYFQVSPTSNTPGWGNFVKEAAAREIPVTTAVTDTMATADDILKHGAPGSRINWRPTVGLSAERMKDIAPEWESGWGAYPIEVPDSQIHPNRETAVETWKRNARYHVEVALRLMPPNLPLNHPFVTVSTWNEIAPYTGWGTVGKPETWTQPIPGFTGWADVYGWQAYYIGQELIARRDSGRPFFRWAAFAFAGGNPEEGAWETAGMLAYLRLCADHPDLLGICLHEYSFTLDIWRDFDQRNYIGRFEKLFAVCDKHGIKRPFVEIKEWGWEERDIPGNAIEQIGQVAAYYAQFPEIKLAAIWTTAGGWEPATSKVAGLAADLYRFSLTTTFDEPEVASMIGIDTSSSRVTVDALSKIGASFGYQRAILWTRDNEGKRHPIPDPMLATNAEVYRVAGIPLGAYGQVYASDPMAGGKLLGEQALKLAQSGQPTLRPMVAVENIPGETPLAPEAVEMFLIALQTAVGRDAPLPIIYTSFRYWSEIFPNGWPGVDQYPLAVAHYTSKENPLMPADWQEWTMWQYAGDVQLHGVLLDMNRLKNDDLRLLRWNWEKPVRRVHLLLTTAASVVAKVVETAVSKLEPMVFAADDARKLGGEVVTWEPEKKVKCHPCLSKTVTQAFGVNPQTYLPFGFPGHEGIDYAAPLGTPFFAVADGVVVEDDDDLFEGGRKSNYGQHVVISHDDGRWYSLYAHAAYDTPVDAGDVVKAGQVVAHSGNTGRSTGPHLHFSLLVPGAPDNGYPVTRYGRYIDPTPHMKGLPVPEYKPPLPDGVLTDGWLWIKNLAIFEDRAVLLARTNFRSGPGVNYAKIVADPLPVSTVVLVRGNATGQYLPVAAAVGGTIDLLPYMRGDGRVYEVRHSSGATETFQTQQENGRFYLVKNSQWEQLWSDEQYIWRGLDTSPGPAPKGTERPGKMRFYRQFETGRDGARWIKRHMAIGETFFGGGHYVQFYYKDDCAKSALNSGNATNVVQLVAHHPMKSWNGLTIQDVVELKTNTGETMFFARGFGLVGWQSQWGESGILAVYEGRQPLTREKLAC